MDFPNDFCPICSKELVNKDHQWWSLRACLKSGGSRHYVRSNTYTSINYKGFNFEVNNNLLYSLYSLDEYGVAIYKDLGEGIEINFESSNQLMDKLDSLIFFL